ncbi:MAG: sulfite exporter TauE/SafE family protein [Verrucomicrobiae bacterium]|nr:sulfite exporter TauE/SafE family protein [Verrucomicrobiae bacterium]
MTVTDLFLLAALGVVAGVLNVLAGGGSLLTLPALVFLGLDGPVANGTNRVAILAQNLAAAGGFRARGFSDLRLSLTLSLAALPGALAGAFLGTMVRGQLFNQLLGAILLAVLAGMVWERFRKRRQKPREAGSPESSSEAAVSDSEPKPLSCGRLVAAHLGISAVGFYGGFIQAGVGFLLMAVLHRVLRLDLVRVNMHKVFIVGVYTAGALAVFAWRGQVLWIPASALATGNSLGGWIGSQISVSKGERWIRAALYLTLLAMAAKLLWPS